MSDSSPQRDPGLDFLRATAILLVLTRHFLDRNPQYDANIHEAIVKIGLLAGRGLIFSMFSLAI
ncbi:MAG: hypothetical protein JWO45_1100 [Spartobacteria bacterium]|nr:hypothetical protein [Spartobacteria bacterium]